MSGTEFQIVKNNMANKKNLQKPKKKLEIKVSNECTFFNGWILTGLWTDVSCYERKPYTPGDLKTFDICYDNINIQGFFNS